MAATVTEPAPLVEQSAGVPTPLEPPQWRTVERPIWRPTVIWQASSVAHAFPVDRPVKRHGVGHGVTPLARVFFALGSVLGVVGLAVDVTFAVAYSPDSLWRSALQALIGAAIYTFATALPAMACALMDHGRRWFAALAWIVWLPMIGFSLMAATGFAAGNITDVLAKRSAAMTTAATAATKASNTASDIKKWREERDAIKEVRLVEEIKLQIVRERFKVDRIDRDAFAVTVGCTVLTADITKACNPVLALVQALAAARRRDKLDKDIREAEKTPEGNGAPIIGSVDPGAETFAKILGWISYGLITPSPDDIALVRILGLTIVPSLSGLAFLFAFALAAPRTGPQSRAPRWGR
jgi:hypothetical protein